MSSYLVCHVIVMPSSYTALQCIHELLGALFKDKMRYLMVSNKNIYYLCEDRIEKLGPRDHRLSSLSKPRDAKR